MYSFKLERSDLKRRAHRPRRHSFSMGLQLEGTLPTPLKLPAPSRQLDPHVVDRTISVHPHDRAHIKSAAVNISDAQPKALHSHTRAHAKSGGSRAHKRRSSSKSARGSKPHPRAKTPPATLAGDRDHSSESSHKWRERESLSQSFPRASHHLNTSDGRSDPLGSTSGGGSGRVRVGEPPAPIALAFSDTNSSPKTNHPLISKPRLIVQTSPIFSRPIIAQSASSLSPTQTSNLYSPARTSTSLSLFSSPPHSAPATSLSKHFDFCCASHSPEHSHASLPSLSGAFGVGIAPRTPRVRHNAFAASEPRGDQEPDFAVFHLRHAQLRHTFASIVRQQRAKFTRRLSHNDAFIKQRRLKQAPVHLDVCLLGPQNSGVTSVLNSFVRDGTLFGAAPNHRQDDTPPRNGKHSPPMAISPMTPHRTSPFRRASSLRKSLTLPQLQASSGSGSGSDSLSNTNTQSSVASPNASPSLSAGSGSLEPPPTRRCVSEGGASSLSQHRRRPPLAFLKKGMGGSLMNLHKGIRGDVSPISPLSALPPRCRKDDEVSVSVTFENVPYILNLRAMNKLPSTLPSSERRNALQRIKVFILCFSLDGGGRAFKKVLSMWVPEIREHCSKVVPVLVVGTHSRRPSISAISPLAPATKPKMPPTATAISDGECRRHLLKLDDPNVIFCGHSNLQGSSGANGVNGVFRQASAHGRRYSKEYARALSLKEIVEASREKKETKLSGIKEKLLARTCKKHRKDKKKSSGSSRSPKASEHDRSNADASDNPKKRHGIDGNAHVGDASRQCEQHSSATEGSAPSSLSTSGADGPMDNAAGSSGENASSSAKGGSISLKRGDEKDTPTRECVLM